MCSATKAIHKANGVQKPPKKPKKDKRQKSKEEDQTMQHKEAVEVLRRGV